MCFTNGQWLQMKMTTLGFPVSDDESTALPLTVSASENGGSAVPRATMREGVSAMKNSSAKAKAV
jgi:hypothetical protein